MSLFAIGDTHLSFGSDKPMDVFGGWQDYEKRLEKNWNSVVTENDTVVIAGDISWGMKMEDTLEDFCFLDKLNGTKIIMKGNHDYWWKSISAVRNVLPLGFYAIQNDAIKFGDYIICGTRLWNLPDVNKSLSAEDDKIYKRELIRLEMTLQNAQKMKTGDEKIICMVHYPPYTFKEEDNEVTLLMEKYGVYKVVYGHIHAMCKQNLVLNKNGITYYLTSCDIVGNKLIDID